MPFVLSCFQASAASRPENSDSDEKDALFGHDTQITILNRCYFTSSVLKKLFSLLFYIFILIKSDNKKTQSEILK
jgi:hypothetical protein